MINQRDYEGYVYVKGIGRIWQVKRIIKDMSSLMDYEGYIKLKGIGCIWQVKGIIKNKSC